ncbi:hypothetical protein A8W25_16450 [Streptomyces sp. ERV7]|nr:hypothetical protein A8W25_16450 [Streptomyces sp. ERV7]
MRNSQPSAATGRRTNEALAASRSSWSRTAITAVDGVGRCRVCRPLTTSRGLRSSGIPAEAHSAGSSILARRFPEAADMRDDAPAEAADGANPKVTVLPSGYAPTVRAGSGEGAAQQGPQSGSAVAARLQFSLPHGHAATSKWSR